MISKRTIIITSLGRTGTQFFSVLFRDLVPETTALHEPDYLNIGQYSGNLARAQQVLRQIRESGFSNIIIKKALGKWSIRSISDARVRKELTVREAAAKIQDRRKDFVIKQYGSIYVESSSAFYGVIDVLPDVFTRHTVIFLIRDGREWVRSQLNFSSKTMYTSGMIRRLISPYWPTPLELRQDPYRDQWASMTTFEKLCWAWSTLNEYALTTVRQNPHARLFHIEDIFRADNRYGSLEDLLIFALSCTDQRPPTISSLYWLDRKMYKSDSGILPWQG